MGTGKLGNPGDAGDDEQREDDGTEDAGRQPLSIPEIVSELIYAGKPLAEIAGYDDLQLRWILFRPRDKYGRLKRRNDDLPEGIEVDENGMRVVTHPTSFQTMFHQVTASHGLSPEASVKQWEQYCLANPRLGRGGI